MLVCHGWGLTGPTPLDQIATHSHNVPYIDSLSLSLTLFREARTLTPRSCHERSEIQGRNHKESRQQVGKAGGDKWKTMSDADKAPFVAKAAKRKTEYNKNMAAYNKKQSEKPNDDEEEEDGSDKSKSEINDDDEDDDESGEVFICSELINENNNRSVSGCVSMDVLSLSFMENVIV
ncbi:hypothetical protein MRB53_000220 [Persea americana]|uniref:Uncharacterized protein n=1 Tax=Persea americana TaxID=3435 RepID=A0ACC2MNA9_PERAE|nr:hypothetical protein MRB53_000220 [Persea americana]